MRQRAFQRPSGAVVQRPGRRRGELIQTRWVLCTVGDVLLGRCAVTLESPASGPRSRRCAAARRDATYATRSGRRYNSRPMAVQPRRPSLAASHPAGQLLPASAVRVCAARRPPACILYPGVLRRTMIVADRLLVMKAWLAWLAWLARLTSETFARRHAPAGPGARRCLASASNCS